MTLNKSTRYAIANVGLGVLLYFAFRLYYTVNTQPPQDEGSARRYILIAVVLYITAGIVIAVRTYYRSSRFSTLDQSAAAGGLRAYGLLGADRMKKITLNLEVSKQNYATLERTGTLIFPPERFNMPIRQGDSVNIRFSTDKSTQQIPTLVTKIDGVNQQVVLEKKLK